MTSLFLSKKQQKLLESIYQNEWLKIHRLFSENKAFLIDRRANKKQINIFIDTLLKETRHFSLSEIRNLFYSFNDKRIYLERYIEICTPWEGFFADNFCFIYIKALQDLGLLKCDIKNFSCDKGLVLKRISEYEWEIDFDGRNTCFSGMKKGCALQKYKKNVYRYDHSSLEKKEYKIIYKERMPLNANLKDKVHINPKSTIYLYRQIRPISFIIEPTSRQEERLCYLLEQIDRYVQNLKPFTLRQYIKRDIDLTIKYKRPYKNYIPYSVRDKNWKIEKTFSPLGASYFLRLDDFKDDSFFYMKDVQESLQKHAWFSDEILLQRQYKEPFSHQIYNKFYYQLKLEIRRKICPPNNWYMLLIPLKKRFHSGKRNIIVQKDDIYAQI